MNNSSSVDRLAAILRNELEHCAPGRKLPSSRELTARHQVSPVTVSRAIAALTTEGLVVARPGAGVFKATAPPTATVLGDVSWQEVALSADPPHTAVDVGPRAADASGILATLSAPPPEIIDLSGGYPHSSMQPERALAAALARAGRRPGTWSRPPMEGLPELREWFAREIGGPTGPLAAEDPDGVVVHIRSLTKASAPSLRVGALTARGPALERLRAVHAVDSLFVPRPLQETALELVSSPAWSRHLRALATALRDRRTTLLTALTGTLPGLLPRRLPQGGFHLWLRLPNGADEGAVAAAALRLGVAVTPGGHYFAAEPPAPHLRLSYVSTPGTAQLEDGVQRLAQAVAGR
jgi:DNA-binding transcriptional MocR family regulator